MFVLNESGMVTYWSTWHGITMSGSSYKGCRSTTIDTLAPVDPHTREVTPHYGARPHVMKSCMVHNILNPEA